MKKSFLILALSLATVSVVTAQVPGDGEAKFSLEAQMGASFGGGQSLITAPTVRMRYFFKNNMAIRLGVGAMVQTKSTDVWENQNDNTGNMGTTMSSSSSVNIIPGFEYHFGKFEHFSPYVAAQVSLGFGGKSAKDENVFEGAYVADYLMESTAPTFTTHSSLLAGFDWFFVPNIYLGAEFGVGWLSETYKEGETTQTSGGTTVTTKTAESKNVYYGNSSVGGIRLGWRF